MQSYPIFQTSSNFISQITDSVPLKKIKRGLTHSTPNFQKKRSVLGAKSDESSSEEIDTLARNVLSQSAGEPRRLRRSISDKLESISSESTLKQHLNLSQPIGLIPKAILECLEEIVSKSKFELITDKNVVQLKDAAIAFQTKDEEKSSKFKEVEEFCEEFLDQEKFSGSMTCYFGKEKEKLQLSSSTLKHSVLLVDAAVLARPLVFQEIKPETASLIDEIIKNNYTGVNIDNIDLLIESAKILQIPRLLRECSLIESDLKWSGNLDLTQRTTAITNYQPVYIKFPTSSKEDGRPPNVTLSGYSVTVNKGI